MNRFFVISEEADTFFFQLFISLLWSINGSLDCWYGRLHILGISSLVEVKKKEKDQWAEWDDFETDIEG